MTVPDLSEESGAELPAERFRRLLSPDSPDRSDGSTFPYFLSYGDAEFLVSLFAEILKRKVSIDGASSQSPAVFELGIDSDLGKVLAQFSIQDMERFLECLIRTHGFLSSVGQIELARAQQVADVRGIVCVNLQGPLGGWQPQELELATNLHFFVTGPFRQYLNARRVAEASGG